MSGKPENGIEGEGRRMIEPMPEAVKNYLRDNRMRALSQMERNVVVGNALAVYIVQEKEDRFRDKAIRTMRFVVDGWRYEQFLVQMASTDCPNAAHKGKSIWEIHKETERAFHDAKKDSATPPKIPIKTPKK